MTGCCAGDVPSEYRGIRQECAKRTSRGSRGVGGTFRVRVPVAHLAMHFVHSRGVRSGSVAFPAPSFALSVAGLTFEGFRRTRLTTASGDERPLVVFAPLQSSILSPWPDDSASSRGFSYLPSIDVLPGVHSRRCDLAAVPTSDPGCRPGHRVPSSRFLTASTAFSALTFAPKRSGRGVAGLLHPAADPGVRRVSLRPPRLTVAGVPERRLSRDAFHTPRRIPLACSRTVSPRPLPPCRSSGRFVALVGNPLPGVPLCARPRSDADFEALLRLRVRSVVAPLPVRHALSFRWALFPFKVPSTWKSTLPSATVWRPEAS
jgi:hypothetical protein